MFILKKIFPDNSGEVSSPMELVYMRKIRFRLRMIDSWPSREFGQRLRALPLREHRFLFVLWFSTLFMQIQYIRDNKNKVTFFELGHSYITALMTTVDVQRITLIWTKSYREVTKDFVLKVHLIHHKNMSDYAMKTYRQVNQICTIFTYYLHFLMIFGVFLFNLTPLIANFTSGMFSANRPENGTFVHCVYYHMPFDYTTDLIGYFVVFFMNLVLTYDAGCCFCVFDLYLSLIVFHVWGHLKILEHHLRSFPRPAARRPQAPGVEWYSNEEVTMVNNLLKKNIKHHRLINEFVNKATTAFGPMLAVYFTFHQVCGCILLLECSKLDSAALMEYGVLTIIVFQQLMQISVVFEFLGSKSETLKDAVYSLPWECMDVNNRKMVMFFLYNVQTPISIKAMGMVPVGVQTMAGILKTSVSYFVMLRTVAL